MVRPRDRDVAALADLADVGELLDRVVRLLALQVRRDGERAGVGQQQRVAVGAARVSSVAASMPPAPGL
jgi:N-acetylglutamate synthase/N-acetylornithine aminotransferase